MKFHDNKNWYRIGEVAQMLDKSLPTVNVWYDAQKYAFENGIHFPFYLPTPRTDLDKRHSRYWSEDDVEKLKKFRDNLIRGDLSFYTRMLSKKYRTEKQEIREDARNFKDEHGLEELKDEL